MLHKLYGIILSTLGEIELVKVENKSIKLQIKPIKNFNKPMKIKDTAMGQG